MRVPYVKPEGSEYGDRRARRIFALWPHFTTTKSSQVLWLERIWVIETRGYGSWREVECFPADAAPRHVLDLAAKSKRGTWWQRFISSAAV